MAAADYNNVVQQLYVAYFGRPADPVGLMNFTNALNAAGAPTTIGALATAYNTNASVKTLIDAFGTSTESSTLYTGSTAAFVNAIFVNVLNRAPALEGLLFWSNAIESGALTRGNAAAAIMAGAVANTTTQGVIDAQVVANKTTVAANFTAALDTAGEVVAYSGSAAAATARSMLAQVSNTTDTTAFQATVTSTVDAVVAGTSSGTTGTTYTLVTGIDVKTATAGNDTFDGSVNANGTATFTSVDQLDGGAGTDYLVAGLAGGNIAARLSNIENAELITSAATTFDMINTSGIQALTMRNSSATLTVNNIAATTGTTITAQDQASDFNLNFANAALAGANAFTLKLNGAQSDVSGGAVVAIAQQAGSDTTGLETLTLESNGAGANFLDTVTVRNAAATSTVATLNVTGAQSLTVATAFEATARTIDASGMTGATGLSASFGATAAVTVTGSGGNDTLTFAANAANSSIAAGGGNDVITLANFDTNDSVAGGDGTADRLNISAANAEAIAAALTNTTGFEQLSLNTATTAGQAVNATRFGSIDTVRLDKGTGGAFGVTMGAGAMTLTIAEATAGTNATLGGALTVTDTGTASTDSLTITNRDTDTTSATDNFAGQNITINGYETVTINTGAVDTAAVGNQDIGTITLNNDSLSGANTLNFTGANSVDVAGVTSNSSGLLTIDASGLTGTAALAMAAAPTYSVATGTTRVTGSANGDTLIGIAAASASTISGGAGNDAITGGSMADTLAGDAGNDTITAGGGNDTVTGGDGNDTIDMTGGAGTVSVDGGAGNDSVDMGATLTASDVVVGGDGTDTLRLAAQATAATAANVSGFETLRLDAAFNQGMEQFTNNSGFTRINYNATGSIAITNAAAGVATIQVTTNANGVGAADDVYSFARLVDTSSNSLTIVGLTGGARTTEVLTINDEETVTINTGSTAGDNLTITTLNAADLTSLTISGANNVEITNAISGAANLATINATASTGTLSVNASTSTANGTFTGSFNAANTITGGTGADTITGGTQADRLTGGNGGDSIDGGAGSDTLAGGLGNDYIAGGIGDDTITGGAGNDTLVGGDGADDFVFEATNGVDTISGFVVGTDDIDVSTAGGTFGAAIAGNTTVTTAGAATGASIFATDNQVFYISANGAAANLTTGGTNTLSTADLTATTLTNLATYLREYYDAASAANANDVVIVLNWTAGGSTTSYIYEAVNNGAADTLAAAELTLIGVVDRGTTVMAAGDLI